jgi:hypothetical protein
MVEPAPDRMDGVRYLPGRPTVVLAVLASIGTWLLALVALVAAVVSVPRPNWWAIAGLCLAIATAARLTRRVLAVRRIRLRLPARVLQQRRYGDLSAAGPDEDSRLRPVRLAPAEVAARTDALLAPLIAIPSVRIFRGVRPAGAPRPVATHAVSAGRQLILVESVAWPPGRYALDTAGRVRCDGQYIGQSIRQLTEAVQACRRLLPRSHRVGALVVVHPTGRAGYTLPAGTDELGWALADQVPAELRPRLARHADTVSRHIIAALVDAAPAGAAGSTTAAAPPGVPAGTGPVRRKQP